MTHSVGRKQIAALQVAALLIGAMAGATTACSPARQETSVAAGSPSSATTAPGGPTPTASTVELHPCPKLDDGITKPSLRRHLEILHAVARRHGGNRSRESGGFEASVDYVLAELSRAGWVAELHKVWIPAFEVHGPGALVMTRPRKRAYLPARKSRADGEFTPVNGTPPGDVTAEVVAAGVALGRGNDSRSGCSLSDFDDGGGASIVAHKIALLQRGHCPFVDKVRNAQSAGARGVLIFNQGDTARRRGLIAGSLDARGPRHGVRIPALFTTTAVGEGLLMAMQRGPVELHIAADTAWRLESVHNVILDVPGVSDDVLIVGAHLDSVAHGPGMNDNASGSATLLEVARQLKDCQLARGVRFAWWAAEEEGLVGSTAYVSSLSDAQLRTTRGYINLDMLAAPNFAFMLTDGDGSKTGVAGPAGSGGLEAFFRKDFASRSTSLLEVAYAGRSDDKPFLAAGVGVVMLGAGYDGTKTAEQVGLFGGTAGKPIDPCYHRACDDLQNLSLEALEVLARSVARAVQHFVVNGADIRGAVPSTGGSTVRHRDSGRARRRRGEHRR